MRLSNNKTGALSSKGKVRLFYRLTVDERKP